MFSVYVRGRKRRIWSTKTVALSVAAHLLVFAAAATAASTRPAPEDPEIYEIFDITERQPAKPRVAPTPPPVPDQPKPVLGDHRRVEHVVQVPTELPEIDPRAHFDSSEYNRPGTQPGTVIVDNPPPAAQPPVDPGPPGPGDGPLGVDMVEEPPTLVNRSEAERLLRRHYPGLLRETGITGRTMVLMIIDEQGRVEPGSVTVQETTNDAFRDPAVRVAEKFRFRPARLGGEPVPVIVVIPIEWRMEN